MIVGKFEPRAERWTLVRALPVVSLADLLSPVVLPDDTMEDVGGPVVFGLEVLEAVIDRLDELGVA